MITKTLTLDVRGEKCPVPTLKMMNAVNRKEVMPGDTLEVIADCDTFEQDVRRWCQTMKKVLISLRHEPPNALRCHVRI